MKNKKSLSMNIELKEYNNFKHRVGVQDRPLDNLGQKNLHDGTVHLEFENEENVVYVDIDKNVFDLVVETYLYGDYINSSNGIMKGQLIRRQKQLIDKLKIRNAKLVVKQQEASQQLAKEMGV